MIPSFEYGPADKDTNAIGTRISFRTSEDANALITITGSVTDANNDRARDHNLFVAGLLSGTTYNYTVRVCDSNNNCLAQTGLSFTTSNNCPLNAVSIWKAENNALDSVDSNPGTLVGNTTYAAGKLGQAFSFDGSSDYVSIADSASLDFTSAYSISFWAYPNAGGSGMMIIKGITSVAHPFRIEYVADNEKIWTIFGASGCNAWTSGDWLLSTNNSIPINTWTHIVLVRTDTEKRIYINGVLNASEATSGGYCINNYNLTIGMASDEQFSTDYAGRIDQVDIYSRELTGPEISALYNSGDGLSCP